MTFMGSNLETNIYFLINSIDTQHGGLTKACLKQASFFAEQGYNSTILTFNFNPLYPMIRRELLRLKLVNENVKIRNLYEELEGEVTPLDGTEDPIPADLKELSDGGALDPHVGYNAYRVYDRMGIYRKYIKLNSDHSLQFIDFFNEERNRIKREYYDLRGVLRKVTFMDYVSNKPKQMTFLRKDGRAYLSKWVNPDNQLAIRVNWFNSDGKMEKVVKNDDELKVHWLSEVVLNDKNPIVVSDSRNTDLLAVKLPGEKVKKLLRLHSSHLDKPYKADSAIHPQIQKAVENLQAFDGILLLTEEQKHDMTERFGNEHQFYTVPHFHEGDKDKPVVQKDTKKAIIVSRFAPLKQINHVIEAFKQVVTSVPDAQLEIWGKGPEEDNYQALIKKLGLENNVAVKGFTHNPEEVVAQGLFTVTTSNREGFSLAIMESMAKGTPVISYDFKYGPKDLIKDNETGMIVSSDDKTALANAMIGLFENSGQTIRMGQTAQEFIKDNFNKEIYNQKWLHVINQMLK